MIESRTLIADAVSSIPNIHCSLYPKSSVSPGEAFVSVERISFPNVFGALVSWNVYIALASSSDANEQVLADIYPKLWEALSNVMNLASVTPAALGNSIQGVIVSGTREEENHGCN